MVVRADREHRGAVNGNVESQVIEAATRAIGDAHALIVSDYDKGVITPRILSEVLPSAYEKMPVLIDPKMRNFDSYRPATLLTPNHHEALRVTNLEEDSDETLSSAARSIRQRLCCDAVLITRGEHGMWLSAPDAEGSIPAVAREVSDVTGAGDTVVAALALALGAGASLSEAAVLANHAAGIVVGKFGAATVSPHELVGRL
jgi:D-beta-D-heptose 7-phosphate kinase/D-beta-D-heptose 1-phosphate adenosyltransferase